MIDSRPDGTFSVAGRTALVTGAGGGIGRAIATDLARSGARVAINDISVEAAEDAMRSLGPDCDVVVVMGDVSEATTANHVIAATQQQFGSLDILVNNASAPVKLASFLDAGPDLLAASLSSFFGAIHCSRAALSAMCEAGFGRVINISSIGGAFGDPGMVLYGAAKGAMNGLTSGLAKEVAQYGVTVNAVAPGMVDTPRQMARPPELRAERLRRIPMGRAAMVEEVAWAVHFLASAEASYVTGEVIYVDGGRP